MQTGPPRAAELELTGVVKMVNTGRVSYAVVSPDEDPPLPKELREVDITFSLTPKVWQDSLPPQAGQVVVLTQLREFDKGWRALSARPVRLSE